MAENTNNIKSSIIQNQIDVADNEAAADNKAAVEQNPIFTAIKRGQKTKVEELLLQDPEFANARFNEGNVTVLELAAKFNQFEIFKLLLSYGAVLEVIEQGEGLKVISMMINYKYNRQSPIYQFLNKLCHQVIQPIISFNEHKPNSSYPHVLKSLNKFFSEFNLVNVRFGIKAHSLLHLALLNPNIDIRLVKYLVTLGADLICRDRDGKCPLDLLLEYTNNREFRHVHECFIAFESATLKVHSNKEARVPLKTLCQSSEDNLRLSAIGKANACINQAKKIINDFVDNIEQTSSSQSLGLYAYYRLSEIDFQYRIKLENFINYTEQEMMSGKVQKIKMDLQKYNKSELSNLILSGHVKAKDPRAILAGETSPLELSETFFSNEHKETHDEHIARMVHALKYAIKGENLEVATQAFLEYVNSDPLFIFQCMAAISENNIKTIEDWLTLIAMSFNKTNQKNKDNQEKSQSKNITAQKAALVFALQGRNYTQVAKLFYSIAFSAPESFSQQWVKKIAEVKSLEEFVVTLGKGIIEIQKEKEKVKEKDKLAASIKPIFSIAQKASDKDNLSVKDEQYIDVVPKSSPVLAFSVKLQRINQSQSQSQNNDINQKKMVSESQCMPVFELDMSLLMKAVEAGNIDEVDLLIRKKADIAEETLYLVNDLQVYCNAYYIALLKGDLKLIDCFHRYISDILTLRDQMGRTAFLFACGYANEHVVKHLLYKYPELWKDVSSSGENGFIMAAAYNNVPVLEFLMNQNLNPEFYHASVKQFIFPDAFYLSNALYLACTTANLEATALIAQSFPSLLELPVRGQKPLQLAVSMNNVKLAQILVNAGARLNNPHCVLLKEDFMNKIDNENPPKCLQYISGGYELLALAHEDMNNDSEKLQKFKELSKEYSINLKDHLGNTLLHLVLQSVKFDPSLVNQAALFLVSKGADILQKNDLGKTPLEIGLMVGSNFKTVLALFGHYVQFRLHSSGDLRFQEALEIINRIANQWQAFIIFDDKFNKSFMELLLPNDRRNPKIQEKMVEFYRYIKSELSQLVLAETFLIAENNDLQLSQHYLGLITGSYSEQTLDSLDTQDIEGNVTLKIS